jgi:hypothetical protein
VRPTTSSCYARQITAKKLIHAALSKPIVYSVNELTTVHTSLNVSAWEAELQSDPDRDFIVSGIKEGFNIVDSDSIPTAVETDNYSSAIKSCVAVEQQIMSELAEGRYVKVQEKPTVISALGGYSQTWAGR